mmetsp:Transcript_23202/g.78360  ORF Transcript_23202/g.78360 Transcript_23202/m.78360 type:complete len:225 (+) Transcript_23202:66-740(+)
MRDRVAQRMGSQFVWAPFGGRSQFVGALWGIRGAAEARVGRTAIRSLIHSRRDAQRVVVAAVHRVDVRAASDRPLLSLPTVRPLPDVANHVVHPKRVWRIRVRRRRPDEAVVLGILLWEIALPRVKPLRKVPVRGAPRERLVVEAAARGHLPLGFRRESSLGPLAVSSGVVPADMNSRVRHPAAHGGVGPLWLAPICADDAEPPWRLLHAAQAVRGVRGVDRLI